MNHSNSWLNYLNSTLNLCMQQLLVCSWFLALQAAQWDQGSPLKLRVWVLVNATWPLCRNLLMTPASSELFSVQLNVIVMSATDDQRLRPSWCSVKIRYCALWIWDMISKVNFEARRFCWLILLYFLCSHFHPLTRLVWSSSSQSPVPAQCCVAAIITEFCFGKPYYKK